jgi:hypothetical protein
MLTAAPGVGVDFGGDVRVGDEEGESGDEGAETGGDSACVLMADAGVLEGGATDFAESLDDVPQAAMRTADDVSAVARQNPLALGPAIVTSQIPFFADHTPVGPPRVGPKVLPARHRRAIQDSRGR